MTPFFARILRAIGETMVPPRFAGDWHGGDDTSFAVYHQFFASAPWFMKFAFLGGAFVLWLCPIFVIGRWHVFTALDPDARLVFLNRFARHAPFELVFAPLRALLLFGIYSRADAWREIGYRNRVSEPRP